LNNERTNEWLYHFNSCFFHFIGKLGFWSKGSLSFFSNKDVGGFHFRKMEVFEIRMESGSELRIFYALNFFFSNCSSEIIYLRFIIVLPSVSTGLHQVTSFYVVYIILESFYIGQQLFLSNCFRPLNIIYKETMFYHNFSIAV